MLIISHNYIEKIGYLEENRYNQNLNPIYLEAKSFTRDTSIKRKR